MKQNQKGFTLIELLVVVAIIGLLASVVVVSLNGARAKARDAKRVSDMKSVQGALELYASDNGAYPTHSTTLGTTGWTTAIPNPSQLTATYMPSLPVPPANETSTSCTANPGYVYQATATTGANYYLRFCLNADTGNYKAGVNYISNVNGVSQSAPSL